ncbi:transcription initiation factor TFIID subunit D4 [Exophiala viscosa]|uniref:Transcription initiation factor TFIID subunit D4 n=1 Tax=Exophiala viscosa TaxID=2486360 RepID=A0AAN6IF36_9EURO|nr:transcription initiation factor TFIID subunit D4 [Exophiala viscosa]KAI1619240.1 transcription initiation factor TFIID subunit D4 [Exophiala viscosa]
MSRPPKLPSSLINTLTSHSGPINAITFSSLGGTYILTGSSDRQIHLSRSEPSSTTTTTNKIPISTAIQKYAAHGYPVLDISVSQDNQTFASVGGDRSVFLWDVQRADGTLRRFGSNTNAGHTSRINCVAFAGESDNVLVSGSDDTSVRLWDVKSRDNKPLMVLEEAKDGISDLCVPGNGYEIVSGSVDGRVRSYDVRMGRVTMDVMPGPVTSLDLSRDGRTVLVGCLDGRIRMMDRQDGTCLRGFPAEDEKEGYKNDSLRLKSCFASNESLVLSGSESDGKVRGWDVLSGKSVGMLDVSTSGRVVSVVRWREGSQAQGRQGLWAGGGADGVVKVYAAG